MKSFAVSVLIGVVTLTTVSQEAVAAGYDTPILYSARHIGMGGTGISSVYDPTAMFMNPAGIGHTKFISLTADFSPIIAQIDAVPTGDTPATAEALAPAFLVGASFRVWDYITLGIGAYPLASAGAKYEYATKTPAVTWQDETTLRFIEISPTVTFNYKDLVRVGIGYRLTMIGLKRFRESEGATGPYFDLDLSALDASGIRAGIQVTPIEGLHIGAVYRHTVETEIEGDSSTILLTKYNKTTMDIVLPARLGVGVRYDISDFGIAFDYEYAFQSQNETSTVTAENTDATKAPTELASHFRWKDASTIRAGLEYRFLERFSARIGYVWDQETSNINYSSAFGTPPVNTNTGTVGFGYKGDAWEVNVAYAHRRGSVEVTQADVDAREDLCLTCSFAGDHDLSLHAAYLDFSWYFE